MAVWHRPACQAAANSITVTGSPVPNSMRTLNGNTIGYTGSGTSGGYVFTIPAGPSLPIITPQPVAPAPNTPNIVVTAPSLPSIIIPVPPANAADAVNIADKGLLNPKDSVIQTENIYNVIYDDTKQEYTPITFLWDLYQYSKEAIRAFGLPANGVGVMVHKNSAD